MYGHAVTSHGSGCGQIVEELAGLDFTPFQDQWLLDSCTLQSVIYVYDASHDLSHDASHDISHDASHDLYIPQSTGRSWINLCLKTRLNDRNNTTVK